MQPFALDLSHAVNDATALVALQFAVAALMTGQFSLGQASLRFIWAAAGGIGLRVGLGWWIAAILLAIGYFVYLFRSFRGKVQVTADGHGY